VILDNFLKTAAYNNSSNQQSTLFFSHGVSVVFDALLVKYMPDLIGGEIDLTNF